MSCCECSGQMAFPKLLQYRFRVLRSEEVVALREIAIKLLQDSDLAR